MEWLKHLKWKQQYSQNCPDMEAQKESRPKSLIAIYPRFYPSTESLTQNIRKGGGFPKTVTHWSGRQSQVWKASRSASLHQYPNVHGFLAPFQENIVGFPKTFNHTFGICRMEPTHTCGKRWSG